MQEFRKLTTFIAVLMAGTLFGIAVTGASDEEFTSPQMAFAGSGQELPDEVVTAVQKQVLHDMRSIGICAQAFAIDHKRFPGPTEGLQPVSELREQFAPVYIRELPVRDPRGTPYLYESDGETFRIIHYGLDGLPDGSKPVSAEVVLTSDPTRDIVWENGGFVQMPKEHYLPKPTFDRRAMAIKQMRSLATAIESYAIDHNRYPGPTTGLQPVEEIRKLLEPTYIANLPANDAWGRPIQYWSDGAESYRIVSGGGDREIQTDFDDPARGGTSEKDADIIFEGGTFTQYPSDLKR